MRTSTVTPTIVTMSTRSPTDMSVPDAQRVAMPKAMMEATPDTHLLSPLQVGFTPPGAAEPHGTLRRDGSGGAGSPRLALVREPDQLRVERVHPQLAFGVRLIEFAEPHRDVSAHDARA